MAISFIVLVLFVKILYWFKEYLVPDKCLDSGGPVEVMLEEYAGILGSRDSSRIKSYSEIQSGSIETPMNNRFLLFIVMSLMIVTASGCTHPDIGKMGNPAHALNDWGFKRYEMDPLVLNVEYTVKGNEITFDGDLTCKGPTGNTGADSASTGWGTAERAVLTLTFLFLDSSDIVVGRETERMMEQGEICLPRHFKVTYPYKDTYKSVAYQGHADLEIW